MGKITVLSLFDGCACAYQAIKNLNIPVSKYYASEIDKYAIKIAINNHPDIIQLGDIRNISNSQINFADLIIGGFPCQDLSIAKQNRQGLDGKRSGLFFEALRILSEIKHTFFLFENVASMNKETLSIINKLLKVNPIQINSSCFVPQNRDRFYWTNIQINQLPLSRVWNKKYWQYRRNHWRENKSGVCPTLTANMGTGGNNVPYKEINGEKVKLTPIECERLQGLPDNYTEGVSNTQRYKMLGNGFTVPVIEHILSFIDFKTRFALFE